MLLCGDTLRQLSSVERIPGIENSGGIVQNAAAELGEREERENRFNDSRLGENLCWNTCLVIAEQLYRYRICPAILAALLCGEFGRILTNIMLGSLRTKKRRNKSEDQFQHSRTAFSVPRNMWAEGDILQETGSCILFDSVESLQLILPVEIGKIHKPRKGLMEQRRNWTEFTCFHTQTGEDMLFAAYMDKEELSLLRTVVSHNQECNPNQRQYVLATVRHSDKVEEHIGKPVKVVRRIKRSLQSGISNCVIAAFGAAAFRFLILEFGHSTELQNNLEELRVEKFGRENPEMIPIEFEDALLGNKCLQPVHKAMVRIAMKEGANSPDDVLELMNQWRPVNNPYRKTQFYENWNQLMDVVYQMIGVVNPNNTPKKKIRKN